jgi:hypothetical protein
MFTCTTTDWEEVRTSIVAFIRVTAHCQAIVSTFQTVEAGHLVLGWGASDGRVVGVVVIASVGLAAVYIA